MSDFLYNEYNTPKGIMRHKIAERKKITRCGMCGIWLLNGEDIMPEDFEKHGIKELEKSGNYKLDYCANCAAEANGDGQPKGYVTRDMAIDAGDLSLEGQPVY